MRLFLTLLTLLASTTLSAQIPQMLSQMIEKYPSAYRRVWYYYNHFDGSQYDRIQFSALRNNTNAADVAKLTESFLSEFECTNFSKATGTLYRSPDSTSVTIKGAEVFTFDLGPKELSAEWGRVTIGSRKWTAPDFRPLTEAFALISKNHKSKKTKVSYTGCPPGVRFTFHRGQGKGLTKGVRTTLYNVSPSDYGKLRRLMLNFIGKPVPVTVFDYPDHTMVKSESTLDFYAVGYNPTTKVLNFLHATVENEICIPYSWQTLDHLP